MNNSKQTLLILTPGFPRGENDTTCLPFLQTHINAINRVFPGLEVIILAFQYPFDAGRYTWKGNDVVAFGGREKPKLHRMRIWVKVWREMERLRKSRNVTGIFSLWCTECALTGSYFGKLHNIKHRVWLCGQDAKPGNKYVRWARPSPGELVAMSDFLRREFSKNYETVPAHVIPLGIDQDEFLQSPVTKDIDVLGVGSLIPLKQYDIFADVIQEIATFFPDIKSVICGAGPEQKNLQSEIDQYNLEGNISLAGEVAHADALAMMQRAKIFLHPSSYEGFGTVCLEALYAGAHVVSFTKPMDADIPHWHHVETKAGMAAKVLLLLKDTNLEYNSVCAYTADDIARQMISLFAS